MDIVSLPIQPREKTGSAESRRLRRDGRVPATLYGLNRDPVSLSLDAHDLTGKFEKGYRVFDLALGGKHQIVLLKDMQVDALTDRILHVDFARVDENQKVTAPVALEFSGQPELASEAVVDVIENDVQVECLPRHLPDHIVVSLEGLAVGSQIRVADLEMPEGVTLADGVDADAVIVNYQLQIPVSDEPTEEDESVELEVLSERKPDEE